MNDKNTVEKCIKYLEDNNINNAGFDLKVLGLLSWVLGQSDVSEINNFPEAKKFYSCAVCGKEITTGEMYGVFYYDTPNDSRGNCVRACLTCSQLAVLKELRKLSDGIPRRFEFCVAENLRNPE